MPWIAGEAIRIVIPGVPKALQRNRHRIVRPKDRAAFVSNYLPSASRNEQAVIREFAARAMGNRAPLEGPIEMRFAAYMPVPATWSKKKQAAALAGEIRPTGKPDGSNLQKLAEDAFAKIVWRDDAQITDTLLAKRYSDRPRLVIEVRELTWQAAAAIPVPVKLFPETSSLRASLSRTESQPQKLA